MSHNAIKIGNAAPDVTGLIAPTLTDLSDVNLAGATDAQALIYDAATDTWGAADVETPAPLYLWMGAGAANSYANTGLTMTVGQPVAFYDTAPRNTLNATLTGTANAAAGWVQSVTLPAGTYQITSVVNVVFSTTGNFAAAWYNTSTSQYVSCLGVVGSTQGAYSYAQSCMTGVFTLAATNTLECRIVNLTGVAAAQGTTISTYQSVFIRAI
jgi:hypothetical protein